MKLGLHDLCLHGDGSALLCQSFDRKFVWMPLEPGAAIEPAEDAVRIESPKASPQLSFPNPSPRRKFRP